MVDSHLGNAEAEIPIVQQFHAVLAKVGKVAGRDALELASLLEHLNTELVCFLVGQSEDATHVTHKFNLRHESHERGRS